MYISRMQKAEKFCVARKELWLSSIQSLRTPTCFVNRCISH